MLMGAAWARDRMGICKEQATQAERERMRRSSAESDRQLKDDTLGREQPSRQALPYEYERACTSA